MPRVEAISDDIEKWFDETGNGSAIADVCLECYHTEDLAEELDAKKLMMDSTHPDAEEWHECGAMPPEGYIEGEYFCACCGKELSERDE